MHIYLYLTPEGQEIYALGKDLFPWHILTQLSPRSSADDGYKLVGTTEVTLPSKESCLLTALERIKEKEQEIQAEAHVEMMRLQERRNNLLSLTYDAGEASE
jgi:hypothetical protein